MNKITYKKVTYKNIDDHFLNGYIRFQETKKVYSMNEGALQVKNISFRDDWNQEKLIEVSRSLKETIKNGGIVYAAYDQKQIVGFASLNTTLFFDEYMNMEYIHASKGYRGYKIGSYLFFLITQEASKKGAKKLYISAHPSIETQKFYKSLLCVPTKKINQTLFEEEPYDIHLEYPLHPISDAVKLIDTEFNIHKRIPSTLLSRIATRIYRYMPLEEEYFLEVCKYLLMCNTRHHFGLGTLFIKRRNDVLKESNMDFFVNILNNYINGWGQVDQYCYRVLNPMIELKEEYYDYLLQWSESPKKDIRRTSLVAMIKSSKGLVLEYDFDKMIYLVEKLKTDSDIHVRKAVGWVLKCSYFKYPVHLEKYLRENVSNLDRMIFRYALEHVEDPLRQELMSL